MPKLGETVVEGIIVRWLKRPGDIVRADEPLAEVESDKVSTDLPSPVSGVVEELCAQEGGSSSRRQGDLRHRDRGGADRARARAKVTGGDRAESAGKARRRLPRRVMIRKKGHRYSPAVRRLAREHGIDPESVRGTGAGGRVTKRDMLRAIEEKTRSGRSEAAPPEAEEFAYGRDARDEILPLTSMRRAIAQRMVRSVQTAPHAWTMVEVDVTNLVEWRESIKAEFRRRGGGQFDLSGPS